MQSSSGGSGDRRGANAMAYTGKMEEFFRDIDKFGSTPPEQVLSLEELHRLFSAHGSDLLGPPLVVE